MHPDGVAVSLEECEELAASEGATNGFVLAARYASTMLPQVFRTDDVLLEIEFAPEHRLALEKLLSSLPRETFLADDSLGWVYQFWQTKRKKEVNESGQKVDGHTLPAKTQLFTEDYMVQFLLQNTIGAWWCAKEGLTRPPSGAGIPMGKCPIEMPLLRWGEDGTPAAGSFENWPKTLAEFTMLDPCCGSGHFLVSALNLLVPLRMHDEGMSETEAVDAVLSQNLFGLELDPRCTQIAAFALALAAWKYPGSNEDPLGYRDLPLLNIACSGLSVAGKKSEWLALANGDSRLREGMERLYDLFRQAPHLGSLIDPRREAGDLVAAGFRELIPLLVKATEKESQMQDADAFAVGISAQGIAHAAMMLSSTYSLVATNVPYLKGGEQTGPLKDLCETTFSASKYDLATVFIERCHRLLGHTGYMAAVTQQYWLFLKYYEGMRESFLKKCQIPLIARLGPGAFEQISGEVVNVCLQVTRPSLPAPGFTTAGIEVDDLPTVEGKCKGLVERGVSLVIQASQLKNPDKRIFLSTQTNSSAPLSKVADFGKGSVSGDGPHYLRCFWEVDRLNPGRKPWLNSPSGDVEWSGREQFILWGDGGHDPETELGFAFRGHRVFGKRGVAIGKAGRLRPTIYCGELFDDNIAVICPYEEDDLAAIWLYISSSEFEDSLRRLDKKMSVTAGTFTKVPFDVKKWQSLAVEEFPDGLSKPESQDATQWLFEGHPRKSNAPLQVAVARLLGYRWPRQTGSGFPDCPPIESDGFDELADSDGIVCIPAVRGEESAADRLQALLSRAFSRTDSGSLVHQLLADAGCKAATKLEDWIRNQFFDQHISFFQRRPFIWHLWDGRKDGFACLVNYHKLSHKNLENVTYSYLGDWIKSQQGGAKSGKAGADLRLAAAQELQGKLERILEGEPPYDIFVRWKPLHEQPIGWNPDLNDGVRMNIRPFVEAGILRKDPKLKWTKDRGKEPERSAEDYPWFWNGSKFTSERVNDVHLTNAEKQAAREAKGVV